MLELLERHGPFDLVILDVAMAEADGLAMIRRLSERAPRIGVIVVSGVGDVRSVVAAMREGASDYLLKPIDRDSLLDSVDRVLGRRREQVDETRLVDENHEFMVARTDSQLIKITLSCDINLTGHLSGLEAGTYRWSITQEQITMDLSVILTMIKTQLAHYLQS